MNPPRAPIWGPTIARQRPIIAAQRENREPARYPRVAISGRGRVHGRLWRLAGYTERPQGSKFFRTSSPSQRPRVPAENRPPARRPKAAVCGPRWGPTVADFPHGPFMGQPDEELTTPEGLGGSAEGPEGARTFAGVKLILARSAGHASNGQRKAPPGIREPTTPEGLGGSVEGPAGARAAIFDENRLYSVDF